MLLTFRTISFKFSSQPLHYFQLFPALSSYLTHPQALLRENINSLLSQYNTPEGKSAFESYSQHDSIITVDSGVEKYREAIHWSFQKSGKQVRPIIISMLSSAINPHQTPEQRQKILIWGALIETLHIASLVHDDVIDNSPLRRGRETVHSRFGKPAAIHVGNYIVAKGTQKINVFNDNRIYQIYSQTMEDLANGELVQANRYQKQTINGKIENYMRKTYLKTGALISHSLKAVPLILGVDDSHIPEDCFRVGEHFGIAFQLVDDVLDFVGDEKLMGKEVMSDLMDRNITLPILLEILGNPESTNRRLVESRVEVGKDEAKEIQSRILKGNYIQLTLLLASFHIKQGLNIINRIRGSDTQGEEVWKYLGYLILSRNK